MLAFGGKISLVCWDCSFSWRHAFWNKQARDKLVRKFWNLSLLSGYQNTKGLNSLVTAHLKGWQFSKIKKICVKMLFPEWSSFCGADLTSNMNASFRFQVHRAMLEGFILESWQYSAFLPLTFLYPIQFVASFFLLLEHVLHYATSLAR